MVTHRITGRARHRHRDAETKIGTERKTGGETKRMQRQKRDRPIMTDTCEYKQRRNRETQ